ncbi:MAG: hypothetical protein QNJ55_08580 [Xenococcus sp. MO_188.B8]|nr:hypothetical protein [Xenococcus sp. MO_188.B8]
MSSPELEKRVSILESELTQIKSLLETSINQNKPWWEEISGTFSDSSIFDQVVELGREYRESSKEEANDSIEG